MASVKEFLLFARLPPELRFMIWKMSILEYHHNRILPVNESTNRIICIRNLACSAHFSATRESRQIATHLYPIRLSVSKMVKEEGGLQSVKENNEYPSRGSIYISTKHDIFAPSVHVLRLDPHLNYWWFRDTPIGGKENFGWRSAALSLSQCQSVRRIMLFNAIDLSAVKDGCRRTPYW